MTRRRSPLPPRPTDVQNPRATGASSRRRGSQTPAHVQVVEGGRVTTRRDELATEEPLAIRVQAAGMTRDIAITMRTPGSDFELAAGFLFGEGIVTSRDQIARISYCVDPAVTGSQEYNVVTVELRGAGQLDERLRGRSFAVTSACGVCGKASLDDLAGRGYARVPPGPVVAASVLRDLPARVRSRQRLFEATGGLHAAAICTPEGEVRVVREDIGRHNAVDKVVGWALLEGQVPLRDALVFVSGRAGYEIAQKCVAAGVPILAAVSAPSSLAVDCGIEFGMTLVGFLRGDRFNVYSGRERIAPGGGGSGSVADGDLSDRTT